MVVCRVHQVNATKHASIVNIKINGGEGRVKK